MPIFEYRCNKCGHITSFLEDTDSREDHVCKKCGSKNTQKIFSAFATGPGKSSSDSSSCPTGTCPLT